MDHKLELRGTLPWPVRGRSMDALVTMQRCKYPGPTRVRSIDTLVTMQRCKYPGPTRVRSMDTLVTMQRCNYPGPPVEKDYPCIYVLRLHISNKSLRRTLELYCTMQ